MKPAKGGVVLAYRYEGKPANGVRKDAEVTVNGRRLDPRFDLRNHSPTGFSWGYSGSGPAQLALAILAHYAGDDVATREYQAFKSEVVAALPQDQPWALRGEKVQEWLDTRTVASVILS